MTCPSGSPSRRHFVLLTFLVVATHVWVLQASPSRIGSKFDSDANTARSFATRSIEAPLTPVVVAPASLDTRRKPSPYPAPKSKANLPKSPVNIGETAIDSVVSLALPESLEVAASAAAGTPSSDITTAPTLAGASTATATATATATTVAVTALPAGPKTTLVSAVALPPSVLLQYKMTGTSKGLNYQANAELSWISNGAQYDAYMKVSATFIGSRSMTSAGKITPVGLAPTRFADKFRSELAAHFIADQGKIIFSANTPDAPWIEGAQDRVSVFLQLGGMLAAKPKEFPPGSEITLYTIGPREADTWTFIVESEEQLQMPGGDMLAIKLTRKPRREFDQKVEIWYAPSLGYLPVRNRITQQNGDFIDQKLSSIGKP